MPIDTEDLELEEEKRRGDPTEDTESPAVAGYKPAMAAPTTDAPATSAPPSGSTGVKAYRPAMGPPAEAMNPSPSAKDLGDFASATGDTKPAASPLEKFVTAHPSPPVPPTASPELGTTEADLRAHAAPTPKYDPVTGKVLPQYHPGIGSRIGRAVLDFARGGIPGAAEGAFGDRSKPGYYGPGAVNSQYFRDEWARQQAQKADQAKIDSLAREDTTAQRDYKNKEAAYKDEEKTAFQQETAEERARHQKETEDLTQQARDAQTETADIKQQLADAKDPFDKANAETDARAAIAKKVGLKGQAAQDYILYGDKAGTVANERLRLRVEEQRLGIEREKATRDKKALNDLGYTTDEQRGINVEAPGAMNRLRELETQRAKNIGLGITSPADKAAIADLDKEIATTRQQIQTAAEKIRNARPTPAAKPGAGRPASTPAAAPAAAPGPKGTLTRSQIQQAVDDYNKTNPKVKATYAGQKKNAEGRGFKVDETK